MALDISPSKSSPKRPKRSWKSFTKMFADNDLGHLDILGGNKNRIVDVIRTYGFAVPMDIESNKLMKIIDKLNQMEDLDWEIQHLITPKCADASCKCRDASE